MFWLGSIFNWYSRVEGNQFTQEIHDQTKIVPKQLVLECSDWDLFSNDTVEWRGPVHTEKWQNIIIPDQAILEHACSCCLVITFARDYKNLSWVWGKDKKSVPRIAVWHHRACQVMTNGDPEGQIFLSYPHMNNGFFFLLTTVFIYLFLNKLPEVPEYAMMQFHMMTLLDVLGKVAWVR